MKNKTNKHLNSLPKNENITLKPSLLKGKVMHNRRLPKVNKFQYQGLYFCLPLEFIGNLKSNLFSFNRFNFFSFFAQDHNLQKNSKISDISSCRAQIMDILQENQITNVKKITLISQPRILGYSFNPASFWLCFDDNINLIAAIVEVRNTFSQKHSYLLFNQDLSPITNNQWLEAKKEFHVSPFFSKNGHYQFRFQTKQGKLNFYINYFVAEQLQLSTSLCCQNQQLTDYNLGLELIKMPFLMFKTIFLIHFQAAKLWLFKKVKYFQLPKQSLTQLTIGKNAKK